MENKEKKNLDRRHFLRTLGVAGGTAIFAGCGSKNPAQEANSTEAPQTPIPTDKMTYRTTPTSGDKVSILGYGCMRYPTVKGTSARENDAEIDQAAVNASIDFALKHGVNYFDTAPTYCKGKSEHATGIALSRHPRKDYFIATKLSNFAPDCWSREASLAMYYNSFKELQVDYIDYMLLHGIGMGGMEALHGRYLDNGVLDFLLKEREAGRIRNLGFSYHGEIEVFDYLLSTDIKWDFVQIQLNYVDWKHAKDINPYNTNAEYLYNELEKRNIPAVIMEPLLGGSLARLDDNSTRTLKERDPQASVASWAFRFAGSKPNILTVLSGMTFMEHLEDNLRTYCPLKPLNNDEYKMLENIATRYANYPLIPCTNCKYCMPCPYGLNIPAIFTHYNKCINEGNFPDNPKSKSYADARRIFLLGMDRSVPKLRQANHCINCGKCLEHCPQGIEINKQMRKIDEFTEQLKQNA
ncbi:MAG: aldo/keto reductase [Candidatus Kapabacteria bacterium]|nr:aldo/keto reductase [Candidatus Kapabacteria bacterium]